MALPLVALAKFPLMAATSHGLTPMMLALLWPFILKFSFTFQPLHEASINTLYALRLFFFQMGHIIFEAEVGGGTRWRRALRLVYGRVVHARHAQFVASREDSLFALSMLAL